MKKVCLYLAVVCLAFSLCACKGNVSDEVKKDGQNAVDTVEDGLEKTVEKVKEITIDSAEGIGDIKNDVAGYKKQVEDNAEKIKNESVDKYQNQQAAVALMEQSVDNMEKAIKNGDKEALEQSSQMFEVAKSLWSYDESKNDGVKK